MSLCTLLYIIGVIGVVVALQAGLGICRFSVQADKTWHGHPQCQNTLEQGIEPPNAHTGH